MEALLFLVIMVAGLAVAALVIGRAQRAPSPDDPTRPQSDESPAATDPRDRPAGPGAEADVPRTSPAPGAAPSPPSAPEDGGGSPGGTS